jgi:outer membrane autotransporter protein
VGRKISTSGSDVTAVLVRTDSEIDNQGTVIASGEGDGSVARGLFAVGSNNLLINSGTVEATGDPGSFNSVAFGVLAEGSNNRLTNSGTVTAQTESVTANGLTASGDNNTVINSGTVTAGSGVVANGLSATGNNNTLINSGTITATGEVSFGLTAGGDNNTLINSGAILSAVGLTAAGDSNTLINRGTVDVFDGNGLFASGDNNTLINRGTVMSQGSSGGSGLGAFGDNNTLTNSGTVTAVNEFNDATGLSAAGNNNTLTSSGALDISGGFNGTGLSATGDNNTLANSGTVDAFGDDGSGVGLFASGDNNTLTNSGALEIAGDGSLGIGAFGQHNTLINRGTVDAGGFSGVGLSLGGDNNTLINSGTVTVSASEGSGFSANGDQNALINTGTLTVASGEGVALNSFGQRGELNTFANSAGATVTSEPAQAVLGGPGNERVINAGTLSGDGTAVDLAAGDDTLQLETTSVINGLSDGGPDIDELILSGIGQGALDLDEFVNFETLRKEDTSAWRLTGSGSFNDLRLEAGELSIDDTITVDGSYVQEDAGTLSVELDDSGRAGRVRVIGAPGTAELAGTLAIEGAPGSNTLVDVVSASGGIQGSFDTVKVPPADGRIITAVTTLPNSVQLATVSPANVDAIVDEGLNNAYLFLDTLTGRLHGVRNGGAGAGTSSSAPTPGSGLEPGGSAEPSEILLARFGGPYASTAEAGRTGAWVKGIGRIGERDEDDGVAGNDYTIGGVALGADHRVAETGLTAGGAFAYTTADLDIDHNGGGGGADNYMAGAYLGYEWRNLFADLSLGGGYNDYDSHRQVLVNGASTTAKGSFGGYTFAARAAGGAEWAYRSVHIRPLAAIDYVLVHQDDYNEHGAGDADIEVDDESAEALQLSGLVGVSREFDIRESRLIPEIRIGVVQEIALDNRKVGASLPGFGGSFTLQGNDDDETRALVGAGATLWARENIAAFVDYNGEFGNDTTSHTFAAGVRISF